jgi:hypothetical protein
VSEIRVISIVDGDLPVRDTTTDPIRTMGAVLEVFQRAEDPPKRYKRE